MAIVGIDLGTTNSLVSVWQDKKAVVIPDGLGNLMQPSVVAVTEGGQLLVSWAAREEMIKHPQNGVTGFKRTMGSDTKYTLAGKEYRSEELSAVILRHMKEIAEEYLGEPVTEAVISVPAYFDNEQRYATKAAAKLAGIKCDRILNEPSAAVLAKRYNNAENDEYVLVFDFGGGTLDVSVAECFEEIIEITAIAGDNRLGGSDFDEYIARYFCEESGVSWEEQSIGVKNHLLYLAQEAKESLTYRRECVMECELAGSKRSVCISEALLYEISRDLFARIRKVIERAVMESGLKLADISRILLVGGSSQMPVVQKYLNKLFDRAAAAGEDAEHLVALGVGVYTAIKTRKEGLEQIVMTDVCPFSLGVNVNAPQSPETLYEKTYVMIERNSILPARVTGHFCTLKDNQKAMLFKIYQGEKYDPRENTKLGELNVTVPQNPAREESATVTFTYDLNGILLVEAVCDSTGEKFELMVSGRLKRIKNNELKSMGDALKSLEYISGEEQQRRTILAMGERLYEKATGELREYISRVIDFYMAGTAGASPIQSRKAGRRVLPVLLGIELAQKKAVFDAERIDALEDLFQSDSD